MADENRSDGIEVGVALVSLSDWRLEWVSPQLCNLLGYSAAELRAKTFHEVTHPDDIALDAHLAKRLAAGEIEQYEMEKRYVRGSGEVVRLQLTASIVRDRQGNAIYGLGIVCPIKTPADREDASGEALLRRIQAAMLR